METVLSRVKKSFIILVVAVQVFGYSLAGFSSVALAEETTNTCPSATGTVAPTGAAAHTFTFNSETCTWENAYYSWSPVTKQYTAKYSQTPVYNPDTNAYEHTVWEYVSSAGQYQARLVSVPAPSPDDSSENSALPSTSSTQTPSGGSLAQSTGTSTISNTGTSSDNTIDNNNSTDVDADISNGVSMLTTLNSNATSGDASILQNTNAGSAKTGNAEAIANILNMIQSSWNPSGGDIATFNADLYGNYFGDLLFDPSLIMNTGTSSTNTIANNQNTDLKINAADDASIVNDINLNATSGNATVSDNTTAGDATTGDATAIANVINMINSMIMTGQSFLGAINLRGDLNGDILLPESLLAQLMNTGTNSTNTISSNSDTDIDADINTNSSITNNTNLTSTSGNALISGNTHAGNATTGDATTSVQEMNLIGQNVTGTKGLLVFVNVLGSWIGMLFNAPGSSTILGTGTDSTNTIANNTSTDVDVNVNRDYEIINNLNLNARSGNATISGNTRAGNATTGDATTSVNLLNMIDSSMNFTDWFGVLFINVFGNWRGSFGVNTEAGNPAPENKGAVGASSPTVASASTTEPPKVFNFVPKVVRNMARGVQTAASASSTTTADVAAATSSTAQTSSTQTVSSDEEGESNTSNNASARGGNIWLPVVFGIIALGLIFGERLLALIRR